MAIKEIYVILNNSNYLKKKSTILFQKDFFTTIGLSSTITTSLSLIKKGGTITLIGMHESSVTLNNVLFLTTNNITIRGVYGYNHDIFKTAISLLEKDRINVKSIITNRIRIDEVPQIFEKLSNPPHEELKVIVDFE